MLEYVYALVTIVVSLVIFEQVNIYRKKGKLPGPAFQWPLVGGIIEMVNDPASFWIRQDNYGRVSWNYLVGMVMFHTTEPELSRKVLNADSPDKLKMRLHPNAEKILGSNNIAFMQGAPHKQLRAELLPLFTKRALSCYLSLQERIVREKVDLWTKDGNSGKDFVEFRPLARDLNTTTSNHVFVGPYLSPAQMKEFHDNYQKMNEGFLSLPLNYPGSKLSLAIQARHAIVDTLLGVVKASKARLSKPNQEPECLLDFWMEKLVSKNASAVSSEFSDAEPTEVREKAATTYEDRTDYDIACTVLDFLFASQDASTSSLVWSMAFLADYPDVLAKVKEEQLRLRPDDDPISFELVSEMTYTKQVVKEILRIRPPATLVPQEAQNDFPLTDDIIVPKGALITPSLWKASSYGYPDPEKFDPDRFSPERQEDVKYAKNFLVFGAGPHACMGKEYAVNHLIAFVSIMSTSVGWERKRTRKSDEILFGPTIYPADCLVRMQKIGN